jgi:putative DNA primase/helicase
MTAEFIAKRLGGHKVGKGWSARCPAHRDRNPSLSIEDSVSGRVLVKCWAGCPQHSVIAELRKRGLWGRAATRALPRSSCLDPDDHQKDPDAGKRTEEALAVWEASLPATATPVETYLAGRKIRIPLPDTLRYHPALPHPSGYMLPAMVALVTRGEDDVPLAIHRTFLAAGGKGKAPVDQSKMMKGPCSGGAVRLADTHSNGPLMIGEGIETCLAAMQAKDYPAWAALSTSGLRALDLPVAVRDLIVLADGDDAGESAARECASRWVREGRRVQIARPPQGFDFNDMLLGRATRIKEDAR